VGSLVGIIILLLMVVLYIQRNKSREKHSQERYHTAVFQLSKKKPFEVLCCKKQNYCTGKMIIYFAIAQTNFLFAFLNQHIFKMRLGVTFKL